jgi:hypothetical protein
VIFLLVPSSVLDSLLLVPVPLKLSALPLGLISSRLDLLLPSPSPHFSLLLDSVPFGFLCYFFDLHVGSRP